MKLKTILTVLVVLVVFTGCKNIEKLETGNQLAIENQTHLEANVVRHLANFEKLARAHPDWTDEDQAIFNAQKAEIAEQLAINYAWLLTIDAAVHKNDLDPAFFGRVLDELPDWVRKGKAIADLIKDVSDGKSDQDKAGPEPEN